MNRRQRVVYSDTKIFRLHVTTDNDAFQQGAMDQEIVRILREIADRIERQGVGFPSQTVLDINGNDVGRYALKTLRQWDGK